MKLTVDDLQRVSTGNHGMSVVPCVQLAEVGQTGSAHPDHEVFVLADVGGWVLVSVAAVRKAVLPIFWRDYFVVVGGLGLLVQFLVGAPSDTLFGHFVGLIHLDFARDVEKHKGGVGIIEQGVGDQSAGVVSPPFVIDLKGLARGVLNLLDGDVVAGQLAVVERLDVSAMVLVEVLEAVIEQYGGIKLDGQGEVEDTSPQAGDGEVTVGVADVLETLPGSRDRSIVEMMFDEA